MTRAIMALVVLALMVPLTAQAQAQQTNAPPGNSAIDEYLETVPGASGSTRPRPPAQGGDGVLTATERARLERLGADGKTLADAVDATAPTQKKGSARDLEVTAGGGRSPARGVLDAVTGNGGGGGMGLVLPAILIGALLAAITVYLLRRRAASAS
ncbi:MAG: hypothetical protein M3401_14995 [Actinomycetota bacterium]|nr:hypothetical protein [Actinomycetota bacterium]